MLQNLQLYNVRSTSCKLQSQFAILNYNYNLQLQCKIWFHLQKKFTTTILNLVSFVKKDYKFAKLSIKRNLQLISTAIGRFNEDAINVCVFLCIAYH